MLGVRRGVCQRPLRPERLRFERDVEARGGPEAEDTRPLGRFETDREHGALGCTHSRTNKRWPPWLDHRRCYPESRKLTRWKRISTRRSRWPQNAQVGSVIAGVVVVEDALGSRQGLAIASRAEEFSTATSACTSSSDTALCGLRNP